MAPQRAGVGVQRDVEFLIAAGQELDLLAEAALCGRLRRLVATLASICVKASFSSPAGASAGSPLRGSAGAGALSDVASLCIPATLFRITARSSSQTSLTNY